MKEKNDSNQAGGQPIANPGNHSRWGKERACDPGQRPAVPLATTESKGIKDANEQPSETQAPPVFAGADLFD